MMASTRCFLASLSRSSLSASSRRSLSASSAARRLSSSSRSFAFLSSSSLRRRSASSFSSCCCAWNCSCKSVLNDKYFNILLGRGCSGVTLGGILQIENISFTNHIYCLISFFVEYEVTINIK